MLVCPHRCRRTAANQDRIIWLAECSCPLGCSDVCMHMRSGVLRVKVSTLLTLSLLRPEARRRTMSEEYLAQHLYNNIQTGGVFHMTYFLCTRPTTPSIFRTKKQRAWTNNSRCDISLTQYRHTYMQLHDKFRATAKESLTSDTTAMQCP